LVKVEVEGLRRGGEPLLPEVNLEGVRETNTKEGHNIVPFFTAGDEGFVIDYEEGRERAEHLVASGRAQLTPGSQAPFTAP